MKKYHSHIPLLIFAISVTLVVAALYGYMFQATSMSVSRAALARDIVASEEQDQSQSKLLSSLADSTAADRAHLNSFFVSSNNVVSFITNLESLGSQSGTTLTIASINTDTASGDAPGTTGHVSAHISAYGTWSSVMRLLDLAEQMQYASTISHVQLSGGEVNAKSGRVWNIGFDVQALLIVTSTASSTNQ